MGSKYLTAALAALGRVLADPRVGFAHRSRLLKAKRELEKIRQAGKLDRDKVFRATELIATVLCEVVSEQAVADAGDYNQNESPATQ